MDDLSTGLPDLETLKKQLPTPAFVTAPVAKPQLPADYVPLPQPKPPAPEEQAQHTDNFGWIKNLPKSMMDLTKSIVYDLPKAVLTAGVNYAKDPEQYGKDLNLLFAKHNGLGGMFREQMVDYYTKDFWHNFNEDPAHLLADAAAVLSMGGGTLAKAGELGKIASVARVGESIARVGHALDPLSMVGKVAGVADAAVGRATGYSAGRALEALGFGKYTQEMNAIRGRLAADQALKLNDEMGRVLLGKLQPAENDRLLRLIRWGDRGEIAAAETGTDLVSKRFRAWREMVTGGDEPLFKDLNLLDDNAAKQANAAKMAEYSQGNWRQLGLQKPITTAEALNLMDVAKTHNPTFMSSFRMKSQANDLFEMANKSMYRGGTFSRFEQANGNRVPISDVDTIQARMLAAKHDALLKIRTAREIDALMQSKNERFFQPTGGTGPIPETHAPLQGAFHEKYYGDTYKAASAILDQTIRDIGKPGMTAEETWAKARLVTDAAIAGDNPIARQVMQKGDVYVPKHVAAWLNRELAPISPGLQMYEKVMRGVKPALTLWNPKFWGSVIFGNTILGLAYGVSPDAARIMSRYKDFLPPELKAISRAEYFLQSKGIYSRTLTRAGDWAQKLDNMFRNPIFAQEIGKNAYARMKFAGGSMMMSMDQLGEAVKHFGMAGVNLGDVRALAMKLQGEYAGGLEASVEAQRKADRLGQLVSKSASREGPRKMAPGYDWAGNKIVEPVPDYGISQKPHPVPKEVGPLPPAEHLPGPDVNVETGLPTGKQVEKAALPLLGQYDSTIDPLTGLRAMQEPEIYGAVEPGRPLSAEQVKLARRIDKYGNMAESVKSAREDAIHKLAEIGELHKQLPGLEHDAAIADRAIEVGNRFYGSYFRLSPFERKTMRNILPFYTFNKAMTSLAFRFPFLYPKRAFIGAHLAQAWNDMMSDENSFLPARLKDYVPVMAMQDGSVVAISAGYLNPLGGAKVGNFAELPLPSVFNPLKSNPVIQLILKMNGAIPEWSGKPLSPGDYATRLDNGTVVEWTGRGFRTVVAQPSLFKSLFDLFPQSQLIDRLVHPFAQTDRGWLFHPDPLLDPEGKPKYPKELLDLLLSNFIPTQTYNLEDVQNQERVRVAGVIKSYARDMRFATPVRRAQIQEILSAWQNEKNRKFLKD